RSSRIYLEETAKDIDRSEVWMEDQRIALVRDHILENYHKKTRDKMYTAMFTVQSRPMATKYYEAFQQAKQEGKHDLNIAGIFTYHPNEDAEEKEEAKHSRDVLEEMIEDYNATFETNFSSENFDSYFSDVSKRMKNVIPGERIDILIVVDMFLTGFDSRKRNTLYVDRNMKHHGLSQAYRSTNRVEKAT